MKWNCYNIATVVCRLLFLLSSGFATSVAATDYQMPRNLNSGWDGSMQLGALATYGIADTSAISARTDFTYRGKHIEHELNLKFYRSTNRTLVNRRDADGIEVMDANGAPVQDRVRTMTNDRRYVSFQPRWFFSRRHYLFVLVDFENNTPADIESSTRQISGVGYKLYKTSKNYISAAVGVGRKKLVQVSGETEEGAIGYLGLRLKRAMSDTTSIALDLDSDFGGENRFSEAEASLAWKLREPMSIKFKYEARFNSNIINPLNTFEDDVEAALSVNLEIEVF